MGRAPGNRCLYPEADRTAGTVVERRTVSERGSAADARDVRCFGGCAATHLKGTVPVQPFFAILSTPWVVVTVPALVLCARLLGWSQEVATEEPDALIAPVRVCGEGAG